MIGASRARGRAVCVAGISVISMFAGCAATGRDDAVRGVIAEGAFGGGRRIVRRNLRTGTTTVIAEAYQGKRLVAPNDVTTDARGRIYFTDARYAGNEPIELPNAVYRIDPDGTITQ